MTKSSWIVTLSLAAVIGLASAASAKAPAVCDATAVGNSKKAVEAACPCDGQVDPATGTVVPWKNHGQYVKCVTKARKVQGRANGLAKQCLNAVMPCAATSACGKSGAVACVVTIGTCLDTNGDLTPDSCDTDSSPCVDDAGCSQSQCQVADSSADCAALGGTAVGVDCCER